MKHWLLNIIYIGILGICIAACNSEMEEIQPISDNEKIQVVFTLSMDKSASGARSVWADPPYIEEDRGNEYENKIDLNSLQVLVYDANSGAYWGEVKNIMVLSHQENIYKFIGDLIIDSQNLNEGTLSCKVMVFANCGESRITGASLPSLTYRYDTSYIPMWGVKTITNAPIDNQNHVDLGEDAIDLLRAMAKVKVALGIKGYQFSKVRISHYNESGNCLPNGYDAVANTKEVAVGMNIPPNATLATNLDFKKEGDYYVAYLPEYKNQNSSTPSSITVSLQKTGETEVKEYTIQFKTYRQGIPTEVLDIKRNHYYQFKITKVTETENIKTDVDVSVADWDWETIDSEYE